MIVLKFERQGDKLYAMFFKNNVKIAMAEAPNTMASSHKLKLQKVKQSINRLKGYVSNTFHDELGSIQNGFFTGTHYKS